MNVDWSLAQIQQRIPHRAPFLLVDRVSWLEPGLKARGSRFLDPADPVFAGHFPGNPVYPGVLILEALGQLGALIFSDAAPEGESPSSSGKYFARLDRVRFVKPALPGVELELEVTVLKEFGGFVKASGVASIAGDPVTTAELTFTTGEAHS